MNSKDKFGYIGLDVAMILTERAMLRFWLHSMEHSAKGEVYHPLSHC